MSKITIRCAACGGADVMRDAWAVWDDAGQNWVLGNVFDAAYCDTCEGDARLDELPLASTDASASASA